MKKRNKSHLQHSSYTALLAMIILGVIFYLLLSLTSCATLQKEKGYEHYPRNEFWNTK